MEHNRTFAAFLTIVLASSTLFAQTGRYFKAEHGVGATYVRLGADGSYRVIDREHMGIFLTDEGRWKKSEAVITFSPKDPKKSSYQAVENEHNGKTFLAITSADADAGIVISAEDVNRDLDADPAHLPGHVLFKISAKTYETETKQTYPFGIFDRNADGWRKIAITLIEPLGERRHCLFRTARLSSLRWAWLSP